MLISDFMDKHAASSIVLAVKRASSSMQTQVFDLIIPVHNQKTYLRGTGFIHEQQQLLAKLRETTNIRQLESILVQNNRFLQTLTHLATRFINLPLSKTNDAINDALKQIGLFAGVDRVYILIMCGMKIT